KSRTTRRDFYTGGTKRRRSAEKRRHCASVWQGQVSSWLSARVSVQHWANDARRGRERALTGSASGGSLIKATLSEAEDTSQTGAPSVTATNLAKLRALVPRAKTAWTVLAPDP